MSDLKEHTFANVASSQGSEVDSSSRNMEDGAVRKALRRVDFFILLPIVLLFVFLQFDRTNLGNALTSTLEENAGLTEKDIDVGQTLFTLGIVIWEIPSNILIRRFGAHRWLPFLAFCWGTVTWSQVFLHNRAGFFATRFLLGSFEAGFIPGAAFYLGRFVTRRELAFRYALLWAANSVAGALGGVTALGLLSLDGHNGLYGWQWLFAIEGALTCFVAIVMALHLPAGPLEASTRHRVFGSKFTILGDGQGDLLYQRALADDPTKATLKRPRVQLRDFDVLLAPRVWGHFLMAFLSSVMLTPINTYAPSYIEALGFAGYSADGLNSVGPACNLLIALPLARLSDLFQRRGPFISIGFAVTAVGLLWLTLAPAGAAAGVLYAGVVVTEAGMGSVQCINAAWLSQNIEERQRPIALASYVMCIQLASFVGSNIFYSSEAPRYIVPLGICAGCVLAAVVLSVIWTLLYRHVFVRPEAQDLGEVSEVAEKDRLRDA